MGDETLPCYLRTLDSDRNLARLTSVECPIYTGHMITMSLLRKMADAAFDWASSRGLVRVNSMHGEQEARLVLGQSFSMKDEQGTTTTERVRMDVEEPCQHFRLKSVALLPKY